ncbi:MAG: disulfide bond formation protein B, partial [Gammaproteobacteria bacterium]|nr:disulfide bond formation protein B [Gammaproteobacteria bacterium]
MNVLNTLNSLSRSRIYWLSYIVGSVALLVAALYFQFVLEELPCLLCIQVRLLITLLLLVSVVGLTTLKYRVINIMTHLATVLIAGGLAERSYQRLGTERGFVVGDCGFNLGLPAWVAIEEWLPWLY